MQVSRFVVLVGITTTLMCNCGCLAFYTKRPVSVTVVDSSTGLPLQGVRVEVDYRAMFVLNVPSAESATTDAKGTVVLSLADFENGLILMNVGASSLDIPAQLIREGGIPDT